MRAPGSACWRANYGVPGRGTSPRVLRASWRVLGIGFGGVVLDSVGDASAFLIRPSQSSDASGLDIRFLGLSPAHRTPVDKMSVAGRTTHTSESGAPNAPRFRSTAEAACSSRLPACAVCELDSSTHWAPTTGSTAAPARTSIPPKAHKETKLPSTAPISFHVVKRQK